MDNIDLRRKVVISPAFTLSLRLITAAFVLGTVSAALLCGSFAESIMSIGKSARISAWLCLATLLFADAACLITPASRVICVLLSAAFGGVTAFISYLYADVKLLTSEFFIFAAVIFAFTVSITYVSDRVFVLSPKLRTVIRSDHKLRYELKAFNAVSGALVLTAIISAAVFIL